jgi:tRNA G18 (ribose-2'-O)-methylase SpoU
MKKLRERGVRLVGTSSHKGKPLDKVELSGSVALVIGNEGAGLTREVLAQLDEVITIPHSSKVESLNAGVAASVILYEAARQRKFA